MNRSSSWSTSSSKRGSLMPGHVPGRAVVGEDHPVALERDGDHPRVGDRPGEVGVGLEADAQAHRRQRGARRRRREVARRVDVRLAGLGGREPERVEDLARGDLVVADEAGQDRQAGGVGARPAVGRRALEARSHWAPEPACQAPLGGLADVVQLVQAAGVAVDREQVAVRAALDERRVRDRVRARVGLVGVVEGRRRRRGVDASTTWYGIP